MRISIRVHIKLFKMLFGFLYENKQFRLGNILNSVGVTIIVMSNVVMMFVGGTLNLTSPWIYLFIIGLICMTVAFRLIMVEGGMAVHPLVRKAIRTKPHPEDINYLKSLLKNWDFMCANMLHVLTKEKGIDDLNAVRWSGIASTYELTVGTLIENVPEYIERGIDAAKFRDVWLTGVQDYSLASRLAQFDIDPVAANALLDGFTNVDSSDK